MKNLRPICLRSQRNNLINKGKNEQPSLQNQERPDQVAAEDYAHRRGRRGQVQQGASMPNPNFVCGESGLVGPQFDGIPNFTPESWKDILDFCEELASDPRATSAPSSSTRWTGSSLCSTPTSAPRASRRTSRASGTARATSSRSRRRASCSSPSTRSTVRGSTSCSSALAAPQGAERAGRRLRSLREQAEREGGRHLQGMGRTRCFSQGSRPSSRTRTARSRHTVAAPASWRQRTPPRGMPRTATDSPSRCRSICFAILSAMDGNGGDAKAAEIELRGLLERLPKDQGRQDAQVARNSALRRGLAEGTSTT